MKPDKITRYDAIKYLDSNFFLGEDKCDAKVLDQIIYHLPSLYLLYCEKRDQLKAKR